MAFRPGAHCRLQAKGVLMRTTAAARWISALSTSGSVCVARTARVTGEQERRQLQPGLSRTRRANCWVPSCTSEEPASEESRQRQIAVNKL